MADQPLGEMIANRLSSKLAANRDEFIKIGAVYQFAILGDEGGYWVCDLKNPETYGIKVGSTADHDCYVEMSDKTLRNIFTGKTKPMTAFMFNQLKIKGNMALGLKLSKIFDNG